MKLEPGIISFGKRGLLVKESAGFVEVPVVRTHGSDGEICVKWKTIDETAISGRDYIAGEGELIFKHSEVSKILRIEIINDMCPEKDECFEIKLFEPSGGAKIGNVNRIAITISSDDGNCFYFSILQSEKLMQKSIIAVSLNL